MDTVATVGIAYGLKQVIREQRPDGSDFKSLPSDTSALAFAPAQFLWDRYGWQYGLPAFAAASSSPGAASMPRSIIGTTWPPARASPSAISKIFTTALSRSATD